MIPQWNVVPLARQHDVRSFDCGDDSLNTYLRQYAEKHGRRGISRTYVACPVGEPTKVIGYFSISSGSVAAEAAVSDESLPRYPVPVLHLGRLAVSLEYQSQRRAGPALLAEACDLALRLSDRIGIYAIDLIALSDRAKSFYVRHGFIQLKDNDKHLWLRLKDIRASRGG